MFRFTEKFSFVIFFILNADYLFNKNSKTYENTRTNYILAQKPHILLGKIFSTLIR